MLRSDVGSTPDSTADSWNKLSCLDCHEVQRDCICLVILRCISEQVLVDELLVETEDE